MAPARDLCFTPATELVRLFRARRVSPLELMHALLARIDAVNPTVNAISIPCGFTREGLPVGLQIVGRRRQEVAVLTAAAALEAAQPWSAAGRRC